ncbi:MAG: hypothetical protein HZC12_08765 [Nitrospirae bacterium]|nr:hypothetical protein [Nitrospirota bacterium]
MVLLILLFIGNALASEMGHKHLMTPEMKKHHKTMSDIGNRWNEAKMCLDEGNLNKMKPVTEAMLKAAKNVYNFKLHRNEDKRNEFHEECDIFRNDLERLRGAIVVKDIEMVKKLSVSVDKACIRCHSKFK